NGERRTRNYFGAGPFSFAFASRMTICSIVVGLFGRSPVLRGALTILSATSMPLVTCPKTLYWLSSEGASATMTKNCDEALFGSFERAIETIPRLCLIELNSAGTFFPDPPYPHFEVSGDFVFGSPPWIMKPGMTRWNFVPL